MKYATLLAVLLALSVPLRPAAGGHGGSEGHAMDNAGIGALLAELNVEIQGQPGFWYLEVRGHPTYVITDEEADRMRIIVQIAPAAQLKQEELYRMMQANFDSALDARYAIARDVLWSAYIHPLSPLTDANFRDGMSQAITLAETYGTEYSSGGLHFGGGDRPAAPGQQ